MRIALTGTPGTGKTTVAAQLETPYTVVPLGEVVSDRSLITERDEVRGTDVVDIDALDTATTDLDDVILESHLSHHLPVDRVIVLRCDPLELKTRLRSRGASARSITENAESEALDLILSESVARHGRGAVYEIDTTDRSIESVVEAVEDAISGSVKPRAGIVDFTGYL